MMTRMMEFIKASKLHIGQTCIFIGPKYLFSKIHLNDVSTVWPLNSSFFIFIATKYRRHHHPSSLSSSLDLAAAIGTRGASCNLFLCCPSNTLNLISALSLKLVRLKTDWHFKTIYIPDDSYSSCQPEESVDNNYHISTKQASPSVLLELGMETNESTTTVTVPQFENKELEVELLSYKVKNFNYVYDFIFILLFW